MNDFSIYVPLNKSVTGELVGIASSMRVDRDDERMSKEALSMMAEEIKRNGVNLFVDHEHKIDNIVGTVKNAEIVDERLMIGVVMDDPETNPRVSSIFNKLKKGIKLGLSVGGNVTGFKWEHDRALGKKIKVLDKVNIYEISIVGIPSNADGVLGIPQAIAKSMKNNLRWEDAEKDCPACYSPLTKSICTACYWRD